MVQDNSLNDSDRQIVVKLREKLRARKGITKADLENIPNMGSTIFDDLENEFNESINLSQNFSHKKICTYKKILLFLDS